MPIVKSAATSGIRIIVSSFAEFDAAPQLLFSTGSETSKMRKRSID
jgi:hypothetical protein